MPSGQSSSARLTIAAILAVIVCVTATVPSAADNPSVRVVLASSDTNTPQLPAPADPSAPKAAGPADQSFLADIQARVFQNEKHKYSGCGYNCHGIKPGEKSRYPDDNVDYDQTQTWTVHDKHSKAYLALDQPAGKAIIERLGYDAKQVADNCYVCHAPLAMVNPTNFEIYRGEKDRESLVKEGVGCEVCHGPAHEWISPHERDPAWRTKTAEQKADMGMLDMRNPLLQAERCATCHVGRADKPGVKNWVVTHDMYVAGHPPLPGVDLATFALNEPPHWRWLKNKGKEGQRQTIPNDIHKEFAKSLGLTEDQMANHVRHEKSLLTVVGAAVTMREAIKLTASFCKANGEDGADIALLDCYACHHELKRDAWRQKRGYEGAAGRVPFPYWQSTLAELSLEGISDAATRERKKAEFQNARKAYRDSFLTSPLGDSNAIQQTGNTLTDWLDKQLISSYRGQVIDDAGSKRILAKISELGATVSDYDTARQLAWAFRIVYDEWGQKPTGEANTKAEAAYKALDEGLRLKFLSKEASDKADKASEGLLGWSLKESPYTFETFERLKKLSDFEPETHRKQFKAIGEALGAGH